MDDKDAAIQEAQEYLRRAWACSHNGNMLYYSRLVYAARAVLALFSAFGIVGFVPHAQAEIDEI